MSTQLAKWGNSLAVRIPKTLAETAKIREGDRVSLSIEKDGVLVIRPARRKYSLKQLVTRITPRNRHNETPWGPPAGKEVW
ncbi:MAG TPA: AbrB/MazE/SpoVT family DNA-binding domain-containing protein [Bryobacteraceae bacterium]|nr:AbrB/MazE/SpoVT family DNA-binding domain-containing protein [Bryobacteraceae bacterium]